MQSSIKGQKNEWLHQTQTEVGKEETGAVGSYCDHFENEAENGYL